MIRPATLNDAERIYRMAWRFMTETEYRLMEPVETNVRNLVDVALEQGVIFLYEPNQVAIGMIALVPVPNLVNGQYIAEEVGWWVEPEHRGQTGLRLHRHAEAWARAQGMDAIKMISPAGSDVGIYYKRLGYRPVETHWLKSLR